jgi:hypothetical protein
MILYFDTYITDKPLYVRSDFEAFENNIRKPGSAYKKQTKIDIAKYTLASYATIKWSKVIVRYELTDVSQVASFDAFILNLFPDAVILHERSDSQVDYKKSGELLNTVQDEWIFYSPNNDHPVIANDISIFDRLIKKAETFKKRNNNFISILYSHFSESINSAYRGTVVHELNWYDSKKLDEDDESVVLFLPRGYFASMQILHKDLFNHWFFSKNLEGKRIVRAEDLEPFLTPSPQVSIVPKKEICRHYDSYYHTLFVQKQHLAQIPPENVPPLFIPDGFFDKKIKIAFGYENYRNKWVNINPSAGSYSFKDSVHGTDLKCLVEDIPLFWKDRICEIDINPDFDHRLGKLNRDKVYAMLCNPWRGCPDQKVFLSILWIRLTRNLWPFLHKIKLKVKQYIKARPGTYQFLQRFFKRDF